MSNVGDPAMPDLPAETALSRRELLALGLGGLAMSGLAAQLSSQLGAQEPKITAPAKGPLTLRQRADRKGLLCGTAVPADALARDARLREVLLADANILVPENELKWGRLQRDFKGPLDFGQAEQIYAFAKRNGMKMRGHTLSWWNSQPKWLASAVERMTAAAAGDFFARYVADVATHWRGRVTQWDVVNEPISARNDLLDKVMVGKLGEEYIDMAFHAARAADPAALLVLNQTLIAQDDWWEDHQQAATLALLERLVKRGVPIQALGYEAHLRTDRTFTEAKWRRFLDRVTDLGLKLMITELDVEDSASRGTPEKRDAEVAALVTALLDSTLSYQNCLGLLTWGPADRISWLRKMPEKARFDGAALRPTPRDDSYAPKPMWHAIANALDRAAPRAQSSRPQT